MVKLQERVLCFSIYIALRLIPLSKSGSFVTVTEDEAVQLEFPYPCDSNKVTLQSANRAPFYSSTDTTNLHLPSYQLHRFSVTDENCSVQVDINPVNRNDEATYICQAYRDGVIQSGFTRIRLNVNYPPGDASCKFSINDEAVGNWLPLQCEVLVGSLAGGIQCYQDSQRLPPQSKLVKTGEILKQGFWVRKEHPIFCCSSSLDQPKDMCECNDFVWDPSYTENILNPCPVTTTGQGAITKDPAETSEGCFFSDTVNPCTSITNTNDLKSCPFLWVSWIAILILLTALVIVTLYLCHVKKTNTNYLTEKEEEQSFMLKVQECSPEHQKSNSFNSLKNGKASTMSCGHHDINNIKIL